MRIFTHNDYAIVADTYENSHNWGHKATLLDKYSNILAKHKITYYNRTWETYQYQSVVKALLNGYVSFLIDEYINNYKQANNIKRLSAKLREELTNQAKMTTRIEELNTFYGEL